jgi:hypothetical protein
MTTRYWALKVLSTGRRLQVAVRYHIGEALPGVVDTAYEQGLLTPPEQENTIVENELTYSEYMTVKDSNGRSRYDLLAAEKAEKIDKADKAIRAACDKMLAIDTSGTMAAMASSWDEQTRYYTILSRYPGVKVYVAVHCDEKPSMDDVVAFAVDHRLLDSDYVEYVMGVEEIPYSEYHFLSQGWKAPSKSCTTCAHAKLGGSCDHPFCSKDGYKYWSDHGTPWYWDDNQKVKYEKDYATDLYNAATYDDKAYDDEYEEGVAKTVNIDGNYGTTAGTMKVPDMKPKPVVKPEPGPVTRRRVVLD